MKRPCSYRTSIRSAGGKWVILALVSMFMTACAGQSAQQRVFWPPSPDLPRIQFLKAIKDSSDVTQSSKLSLLNLGDAKDETVVSLAKPYGIAASKGKIYVCDTTQAEVAIIDLPNRKMSRLAGNVNAGRLKKPVNVAVDEKQNLYVVDTSRLEVLQYGADGSYLRSFGGGMDLKPVDVRVDESFLYILDKGGSVVQVFDSVTGDHLRTIGSQDDPQKRLLGPTNMALDGKGALYVSNFGNGRIIKMDRDGNFLMGYGRLGQNFGEFSRPRGIAVDDDGLVYVVDAAAQHVQIFDDRMRLLMFFGAPGTPGSLNIPAGIAVSADNLDYYQRLADPDFVLEKVLFVVSQVGDHLVNVYGVGKKKGLDYDGEMKKALAERERRIAAAKEKQRKAEEEKAAKGAKEGDGSKESGEARDPGNAGKPKGAGEAAPDAARTAAAAETGAAR